jgi:hypothetical protein
LLPISESRLSASFTNHASNSLFLVIHNFSFDTPHYYAYIIIIGNALLVEDDIRNIHWTYADYKAWELIPHEWYEIIYGEAYAASAPNTYHSGHYHFKIIIEKVKIDFPGRQGWLVYKTG